MRQKGTKYIWSWKVVDKENEHKKHRQEQKMKMNKKQKTGNSWGENKDIDKVKKREKHM